MHEVPLALAFHHMLLASPPLPPPCTPFNKKPPVSQSQLRIHAPRQRSAVQAVHRQRVVAGQAKGRGQAAGGESRQREGGIGQRRQLGVRLQVQLQIKRLVRLLLPLLLLLGLLRLLALLLLLGLHCCILCRLLLYRRLLGLCSRSSVRLLIHLTGCCSAFVRSQLCSNLL